MKTVEVTSSHPGSKSKKLSQRKAIKEYKVDLKRTLSARQIQIHSMLKILLLRVTRLKKQQLGTKSRMEPRFQSKVEQILIFQLLKLRNRFHQRVNLEFSSIRTLGLKDM